MTIQQVMTQKRRLRRAAGLLAVEHHAAGSTPDGMSIQSHAESIYQDGIHQAEDTAAAGAMSWVAAATLIVSTYEQLITDMQEAGKP